MNCKPGDLAYVVGGFTNPSPNLGRIVEVMRIEGTYAGFGVVWAVRSSEPMKTVRGMQREFHSLDTWLRPISGVPLNDEVTENIKEPA